MPQGSIKFDGDSLTTYLKIVKGKITCRTPLDPYKVRATL